MRRPAGHRWVSGRSPVGRGRSGGPSGVGLSADRLPQASRTSHGGWSSS